MKYTIAAFFEDMCKKEVSFIGAGVSHRELTKLFVKKGISVTLRDKRTAEQLGDIYTELNSLGVKMKLGENYLNDITEDVLFRTPGMNYMNPALQKAKADGVVITSEMEMFFELCPCEIIAVTGSDGKTTTTTLISELLKAEGYTVHLGGNIGRALLPIIEQVKPTDKAVVELSSFQLISMSQSPNIAVITNIAPNHLDVHKDMEEYINAKKNILLHQSAFSKAVLNLDNPSTIALAHFVRGKLEMFSRKNAVVHGAFVENNMIYYADDDKKTAVLNTKDIRIPGEHNIENYLAAITAVWNMVSIDTIKKVAKSFAGVEHRIEFIRELNGVKWYNDSIATSPTRTIAGLNSFNQKLIIIAGGYDKKIPFEPMAPIMLQKVKTLILTGATSPKIEAAIRNCNGFENSGMTILHAENLTDAVTIAAKTAVLGDIVSLSPACASFDCYPNFEQRGNHFKQLVRELK